MTDCLNTLWISKTNGLGNVGQLLWAVSKVLGFVSADANPKIGG